LLWSVALALSLLMPVAVVTLPSWVQVSLPWETAVPWPRDAAEIVTSDSSRADAASAVASPRQEERPAVLREARAAWPAALIVWLAGAMFVLLRNALAHVGLRRWLRSSRTELSPAWAATLGRVGAESAFRRPLRLLESDQATSPCTFGFVRPVVLLPAAGVGWSEAQRRDTLLHELAHVRRLDYLSTQVANLACTVHWFNPLVWFAAGQARKLQELACDDAVLNAGGAPADYAQFLVGLAAGARRRSPAFPAAVGMVQRSQLHGRVTAILDASRTRLPLGDLALVAALVPLAGLMLFLATLSVAATPQATQPAVSLTASFSSVELRNGGLVHLIHGPAQRVTMLEGDPLQSSITVRDDGRLVIDRCPAKCPGHRDFVVEVVTPGLGTIAVAEGGTIQARGEFPPQPEIGVSVSQGGTIDIRALPVAKVTASVYSGGRIFTIPGDSMSAEVEQGGNVTYWGDAVVESSIRGGGVVERETAANADKLLAELMGPQYVETPAPIAPVPAIAPIPSTRQ
jgi:beta-lactamase regulating signal transducer with metallopeptidase domain